MLLSFIIAAIGFRVGMLGVSMRNEAALRQNGAVEYGAQNSQGLAMAHIAFYVAALFEGGIKASPFDIMTSLGLALYGFGIMMLLIVVRLLGRFWTVKIMIARDHALMAHPIFRWVRHPNYYLTSSRS
jgi:isoprenylcysteine carboxyl methyltransferase (ICMT) family protein YpbQ